MSVACTRLSSRQLKDAAVLTAVKEWPGSAEQVETLLCRPSLTAAALAGFCFRRSRRKNGSAGVKQKNEPLSNFDANFS